MKVFNKSIDRFKDDNDYLIDIVIGKWFSKRLNDVLSSNDAKRINIYKKIDIKKSFKLFDPGFFKKDNYIRSTIVSREAGICFPDPKFEFLDFEEFLTKYVDPDKKFYLDDRIPEKLDLENLKELISTMGSYPSEPVSFLTKLDGGYAFLYLCDDNSYLTSDYILNTLFKEFKIRELNVSLYQPDDQEYPYKFVDDINALSVAKVSLNDKTLKQQYINISVYDIKLLDTYLHGNKKILKYNGKFRYNSSEIFDGSI